MAKIIQLCPVSQYEEVSDVLMYALDDEGNVFRILDGEDTAVVITATAFNHAIELYRKYGEV